MPAADFHRYREKLHAAESAADPDATEAQRAAGVAAVGKFYCHGLTVSVEYGRGDVRRGRRADGSTWERTLANPYGYINRTETPSDGEQLDVWLGDHPESQLAFLVDFLTAAGEHDEYKVVLGARNYREAKTIIDANYPAGFWDSRVGEVRGMFMPEFKKHLRKSGLMKVKARKAAAAPEPPPLGYDWVRRIATLTV